MMGRVLEYIDRQFTDIARPIDLAQAGEPIDKLVVRNCSFTRCERGINGWQKGPKVGEAIIEQCTFVECRYGILFNNVFESLVITDNRCDQIGRIAISVGTTELALSKYCNAVICANEITNVWADAVGLGIYAVGTAHDIRHNIIRNVAIRNQVPGQDDDAVGIYCKTSDSVIANNLLIDAGGYEGCLVLKGNGKNNTIKTNTITARKPMVSQRWNRAICIIANDDNEIADNVIDKEYRIVISPLTDGNVIQGKYRIDRSVTHQGKTDAYVFWPL